MADAFGRVVEFIVGSKKFSGLDFFIPFRVPFDDGKEPAVADIQVFNLSDKSINEIKKDSPVILNAGYTGDVGAVFLGYVEKVTTDRQGVDKVTTVQCVEGVTSWRKIRVQKTYRPGTTGRQILSDLAGMTGLQLGALNLPVDRVYKSGKTINAPLGNAIASVASECGAKAHNTRGKLLIRPKNEGDNIGFLLDRENGLISSPTPIEKEVKGVIVKGWKVVSLLNHRITADSLLQIKSRTANGIFRVDSGFHDGNNFNTEMEVYPV